MVMPEQSPQSLTIRTYQVGFGDCFLLSFEYPSEKRHVLIDFGSTGFPKGAPDDLMDRVAKQIATDCEDKLHAVVATHRHKDHISGFATAKDGKGTGDIIAKLQPDVVIQPWTEQPDLQPDAKGPATTAGAGRDAKGVYLASLSQMQDFAETALKNLAGFRSVIEDAVLDELDFVGDDNLKNRSAIENLAAMGGANSHFVHAGIEKSGLEGVLPGVKVTVLGPPTLEQSEEIRKQRSKDSSEFWQLTELTDASLIHLQAQRLFADAKTAEDDPVYARWFRKQTARVHAESLLSLVRVLDDAMNNTSVILLFEVGGKAFLFPGDAQIENWSFALKDEAIRNRLKSVNVYKVGHHGSLNATPKTSLWPLFERKAKEASEQRLYTLLSTMEGKHGSVKSGTEVPRRTLLTELKEESNLTATNTYKENELRRPLVVSFK